MTSLILKLKGKIRWSLSQRVIKVKLANQHNLNVKKPSNAYQFQESMK